MIELVFAQPTHPLSINESNRLHWAARRRRLEPWGFACIAAWQQLPEAARRPANAKVGIRVTLTFERNGRRDPHNYTGTVVKRLVDTLVGHIGLVPDDTAEWVVIHDPVLRVADDNLCHIEILHTTTKRYGLESSNERGG